MTAENGIEFAIRRVKDGFFLYDDNLDGARPEWVSLADNAAWFGTAEEAVAFAELAGFADDGELDNGLEVADRPWQILMRSARNSSDGHCRPRHCTQASR